MNLTDRSALPWLSKISHHSQIGGIETSVLNDGPARGCRIAWINTGAGLRYKVVIDRAMDISDAFYNAHSLAWISHSAVTSPQPFSNQGFDWLRNFNGGLLTTCGLDHVGGPDNFNNVTRGLHGPVSNIPAEIIAVHQPDPAGGDLQMSITGKILQTQVFGPTLELIRTISGTLGQPYIYLHDRITNKGNTASPHMLLYHINFGWPMADEGAEILFEGESRPQKKEGENKVSRELKQCPAPLDGHNGAGEEVFLIDPATNNVGECVCGIANKYIGFKTVITFKKSQLPRLINWQHWGRGEYVTALEPANCYPTGRAGAAKDDMLIFLQPGEQREYELRIEIENVW